MQKPYQLVIVGGGTAGWMFATAISSLYKSHQVHITLIESEQIGTVGVGEATLPQLKSFNQYIGIDEQEMMRKTNATIKLGIKFDDWGSLGNSYIHPFGQYGNKVNGSDIHQYWARFNQEAKKQDKKISPLSNFSYAVQMCQQGRFEFQSDDLSKIESTYAYAYHFDASLYAKFLREVGEKAGVTRIEGMIENVVNHAETGDISAVILKDGQKVEGDFFIDCSGFRSLLLGQNLKAEFEDWSQWLVCDRAVAAPSEKLATIPNYTLSTAKEAGWQWQIPLQHRTGNGYVYCSSFINDDQALDALLSQLNSDPIAEPKFLKFKAGRYKQSWHKNCVAVGLSSGFLEPLESTSIYLIQIAITSFLRLFPLQNDPLLANEYNRMMDNEYDRIRDFLILHYYLNQRTDSELWRYCQQMSVPDSLIEKMALFKQRGYVDSYRYGLFNLPSWISVLHGQGNIQQGIEPFVNAIPSAELEKMLTTFESSITERIKSVPSHEAFLRQYCRA